MRAASTWLCCVIAAIGIALTAVLPAMPAQAAGPNDLEISLDGGATWSTTASSLLFDGVNLVVPGDSINDQFRLRNVGDTGGVLRITLRNVTYSDPAFASVFTLSLGTPGLTGAPVSLTEATPCVVLSSGQFLAPGQQVLVDANAALGNLTGSVGQRATASFTIRAALHEPGAVPLAPSFCDLAGIDVFSQPPSTPQGVAMTGGELPIPLVMFAAALIGAGLFFVVAARRKRSERRTVGFEA